MITLTLAMAAAVFTWQDADGRLELRENGSPVLTYNYGMQLKNGAPEIKRRQGYIHPVWAPNGAVVTDDFPKDHWHHRGIFWAWPVVRSEGRKFDIWTLTGGIESRFEKWIDRKQGATAELAVEDGWYIEGKHVLRETVRMTVEQSRNNARRMLFTLTFEALGAPLELAGSQDGKGYGGFNIRFAPRTGTVIRTDKGIEEKDTDLVPHAWAEMEAVYAGKKATVRVEQSKDNPGFPAGWCLRKYGFLGANYPGLKPLILQAGKPLEMKFEVTVAGE